jgi:hypothetical protein
VNRLPKFSISKRPYAVDMGSMYDWGYGFTAVKAVWFRRRRGETVACMGDLHTILTPRPVSAIDFVERYTDGRYGGHPVARWDGDTLWTDSLTFAESQRAQPFLAAMLDRYPAVPDGYDGWWTFL